MDLTRWNDGSDTELEQLVDGDLELLEMGRRLRASRPEPRVDPDFQRRLRAQLMSAAESELRPRGLRQLLRPRASLFAYGAAGLGTAMIAAAALAYYAPHSDHLTLVQGVATINGQATVNPDDVITIRFNQEMDHRAVERGLTIEPATTLKPTWKGNDLTLTPAYHLQPNSPYVVTIPRNAARDVRGDVARDDITITFGTSPVAPTGPAGPATGPLPLVAHDAGGVGDDSSLGFTGDGSLIATAGLIPSSPAPPTGAPAPGGEGTGSAAPAPAPVPALVRYGADGPVRLGDAVAAVALSPAGHSLATISPSGDGIHAVVAVSDVDGSHRSILSSAADAGSPLGWGGDATHPVVLFVSGGQVTSVDLEHHTQAITGVHLVRGQAVRFAPGGRYVFVGPAPATSPVSPPPAAPPPTLGGGLLPGVRIGPGGNLAPEPAGQSTTDAVPFSTTDPGRVVDLGATAGAATPLQLSGLAAGDLPVFSADGHRVAWIDRSGAQPSIAVQSLDGSPAVHVALPALGTGDGLTAPAVDLTAERVAYGVSHADGSGELRLVRVGDGSLLATASVRQPAGLVFSPDGAQLAYLQRTGAQTTAEVTTAPGAPSDGTAVPAAAARAIDRLVTAEVAGDHQALDGLVAPAVETDLLAHLPGGLSRGYVISAVPSSGSDVVTAQIRLLRDPTNDHPTAAFTDERVILRRAGGDAFVVGQADIARPLHDEPSGPQVVHVDTSRILGLTTVRITFDSDLDPASVGDSVISLAGGRSGLASPTVSYDAASRTVSVSFGPLRQPLELTVGIGLRDVNGQGLAAPFTTQISPGQ